MTHRRLTAHHLSPRLSPRHRWWAWGILGLLWLSGAAWLYCRYGLVQHGEFGDLPHPLQGWVLRLHGLAAFASLWLLGLLWGIHITRAWPTRKRRYTGIGMFAAASMLVLSGYLLYYGGESLRDIASPLHWLLGLASLPLALAHMPLRQPRQNENSSAAAGATQDACKRES
jgi:hypothetical protein